VAIQYASGVTKVYTTGVVTDKADLCALIHTNITTGAGWGITNTTSSTDHTYQSQVTPQGNQIQVRVWDDGGTTQCVRIRLSNNALTLNQVDSCYLFPSSSATYAIIANQFQFCIFVPGSISTRNFVLCSALYIPPFLVTMGLTTSALIVGDGGSDTDTSNSRGSWRTSLTSQGFASAAPVQGFTILNATTTEYSNFSYASYNTPNPGFPCFATFQSACMDSISGYRWHDGSAFIQESLVGWGTPAPSNENKIRGQIWDAFISTEEYTADTTTTVTLDSNTWYVVTSSNNGTTTFPTSMSGSLMMIAN
jgi:hypothetical protein